MIEKTITTAPTATEKNITISPTASEYAALEKKCQELQKNIKEFVDLLRYIYPVVKKQDYVSAKKVYDMIVRFDG